MPLSYFEGPPSGEVASRIADANAINNLVSQIVLGLPSQFFIAVISLGFMLFYSVELTLASIVAFIIVTGVNWLFLPAIRQKTRNLIISGTENQGFLVETFRGVQVLKTTQATSQAWEEYQSNYGRLANLGWSNMLIHPEHGLGWNHKQVSQGIERYKMFLYLIYLYPNRTIIPTREIDTVWHYHILDTHKYAYDCEFLFGYFLHHNPNFDYESETLKLAWLEAIAETIALSAEHFGISLIDENDFMLTDSNLQQVNACVDPRSKWLLI
ncbi:peptidase [Calothrix sp. NIES-4071]|nr:peptidase [Calothrix sp. NIES-4071]BAZ55463.1 peptidase [Calothrix sp. NIES-4105]